MHDGHLDVALPGKLGRALLVALLLHAGKVRTQDQLIDDLWGERLSDGPTQSLHNLVSKLRAALGGWRLETAHCGYVLHVHEDEVDAFEFERLLTRSRGELAAEKVPTLERALRLWSGDAFLDVRYETFVQAEARRLEELRAYAEEELVAAKLELGEPVVADLQRLLGHYPFRERLRMLFMTALHGCGRSIEALAAYADWECLLRESWGVEPSRRIHELAEAIRTGRA